MTDIQPWGILGNPSKEKIQEYCNMPYGEFRKFVKSFKGKKADNFTVDVTKKVYSTYTTKVKVVATSHKNALEQVMVIPKSKLEFSDVPVKVNLEEYSYGCAWRD
jgi:hypothetical protein